MVEDADTLAVLADAGYGQVVAIKDVVVVLIGFRGADG